MNTSIKYLGGIIIVILIALFVFNAFMKDEYVDEPTVRVDDIPEVVLPLEYEVVAPEQAVSSEVYIEKASVVDLEGGYVVLHRTAVDSEEVEDMEGEVTEDIEGEAVPVMVEDQESSLGVIIGVSALLPQGFNERILVSLNDGEELVVDEVIYAVMYIDDADGVFNVELDSPAEGDKAQTSIHVVDQGALEDETKL